MNRKRLTALLSLCAALCLLPALALAEGAAGVAIDPTNFPDANFLTYVSTFDTDNDDCLSPAELAAVKSMRPIGKSIGDLTCGKARYTVTFGNDRAPAQTVTHGEKAVEPPMRP